jgi:hypothetical protein
MTNRIFGLWSAITGLLGELGPGSLPGNGVVGVVVDQLVALSLSSIS